ncbi:hypothetical protein ACLOJK_025841 [Asimina triloba]
MAKISLFRFFFLLLLSLLCTTARGKSALFIFGDSTVDPGNNNYIQTTPEYRADCKPYGQNGFFEKPTGRFSDGRTIADFIGNHPSKSMNSDHGFVPQVIDLHTQLKYFEKVQGSLTEKLGDGPAKKLISEAVYFFSIGSNDYMGGYLGNPKMLESFTPEQYVGMVIGNLTQAIQVLYEKGGRKFGFLRLAPLGCLPALRAANPNAKDGGCFQEASALAMAHNNALAAVLTNLEHILEGFKYSTSDFYTWLDDRIRHPAKYGTPSILN